MKTKYFIHLQIYLYNVTLGLESHLYLSIKIVSIRFYLIVSTSTRTPEKTMASNDPIPNVMCTEGCLPVNPPPKPPPKAAEPSLQDEYDAKLAAVTCGCSFGY